MRAPIQDAQMSSIKDQLKALRNNVNNQINIFQEKAIQEVNYICEFCRGQHFSGDCSKGGILMILEDIEQVDAANFAPVGNSYNPTWWNHPNFSWNQPPTRNTMYQPNFQ